MMNNQSLKKTMLFFSAKWCKSCVELSKKKKYLILKSAELEANFLEINLDDLDKLNLAKKEFKLNIIPTIVIIEKNKFKKYEGTSKIEKFINL